VTGVGEAFIPVHRLLHTDVLIFPRQSRVCRCCNPRDRIRVDVQFRSTSCVVGDTFRRRGARRSIYVRYGRRDASVFPPCPRHCPQVIIRRKSYSSSQVEIACTRAVAAPPRRSRWRSKQRILDWMRRRPDRAIGPMRISVQLEPAEGSTMAARGACVSSSLPDLRGFLISQPGPRRTIIRERAVRQALSTYRSFRGGDIRYVSDRYTTPLTFARWPFR